MDSTVERILQLARAILNHETDLIGGTREIAEFDDYFAEYAPVDIPYEDYEIFMDVEDETHNLPIIESERKHWSPEALRIKDEEKKKIEEKYRTAVENACRQIIKKLECVS